jgi:N4-gp56 family major capsid protein
MAVSSTNIGAGTFGSPSNGSVRELPGATDWSGQDSTLKPEIWSELVRRDVKEKNIFRDFIGGEGGGQPIVTKRDLSAGGKTKVTFTSTTPIRGQGVLGENQLKGNEDNLRFGTHSVQVDLIRHAVAYTQVLQLLRFTGKTLDQLSAELMSDWAARKQQDDLQCAFRNEAIAQTTNHATSWLEDTANLQWSGGATAAGPGAKLSTDVLEKSKLRLISLGAQPMTVDSDYSGADLPQYLAFAPANVMNELRADSAYTTALQYGADRSTTGHPYFKGTLPAWENNIIFSHNLIFDTAEGRQGSPLMPIAFLGADYTNSTPANCPGIPGGGQYGDNGLDYFANFLGYDLQYLSYDRSFGLNYGEGTGGTVYPSGTGVTDAREYHLTIYDTQSHHWVTRRYKANTLGTEGSVTAGSSDIISTGQNDTKNGSVATKTLGAGSIIYQSTKFGVPLAFMIHTGANSIYHAEGAISNEPIYHYDDFATSGGRAHLTATGVQSVRGLGVFKDTLGRIPNHQIVAQQAQVVGVNRVTNT